MEDQTPTNPYPEQMSSDEQLDLPVTVTQRILRNLVDRLDFLEHFVENVKKEHDNLRQSHSNLQDHSLEQAAKIKALQEELENPRRAASPSSKPREPKIPDPPKFLGDKKSFLPWVAKCRMKFKGQPSLFPNETCKVMYAAAHLDGPLFAWFTPLNERFNRGEIPSEFASFETFVDALTVLYGDPYLKQTAERDLRTLIQTTSVAVYIAKFEECRQYLAWNDEPLRHQFYHGLKPSIKDELVHHDETTTLASLKELALRIDARQSARWQEKQS